METILKFLESYGPLSDELRHLLTTALKYKVIQKKEYLLEAGRICQNIYFIEQGLLRCFYNEQGKEKNCWFMKEGDVAISVRSFFKQTCSVEYIQALEETRMYYISYQEYSFAKMNFPEFNFIRAEVTEKYYLLSEDRNYFYRKENVADEYDYFLTNYPDINQRIPDKYIASYLNVTREHLCIIRKERQHKKIENR